LKKNFLRLDKKCSSTLCREFQFAYCIGTFEKIDHFLFVGWNGFFAKKMSLGRKISSFLKQKKLQFFTFFWLKNVSEVLKPLNKVNLAFCMFVKLKNRGGQRTFGRGLLYDSWSIFINFKNYWIWNCSIFLKS